jgi:16S rRNA (cytosine967-C5)-methyltransferase
MHFLDHQPDYAIVNSAVDLAKEVNPKFAGLVNKVLRKILSEGQTTFEVSFKNPEATYCVNHSFPVALYRQIVQDYDEPTARRVVS